MLNANVTFYFRRYDSDNYKVPFHSHKCYELVYYYSGKGYCRIENKKYNYEIGTFVVIPPDSTHNDVHKSDCELACIGFSLENNEFTLSPGNYSDPSGKIGRYLAEIDVEFKERQTDFMEVIGNLLKNVLYEIKRESGNHPERSTIHEDILHQVLNYIDEYFLTDISPEQLATISQYSYDRFRHIFKNAMHISPKQYIINKRLEYSKTLLATTPLSITEIAFQCGFSSTSHYIQSFKKATNITPAQYRKQLHSEYVFSQEQTTYKK